MASDIPVLREVCADSVLYFDPLDKSDIVKKMNVAMVDEHMQKDLIKRGFENKSRFNWKQSYELHKKVLKRLS